MDLSWAREERVVRRRLKRCIRNELLTARCWHEGSSGILAWLRRKMIRIKRVVKVIRSACNLNLIEDACGFRRITLTVPYQPRVDLLRKGVVVCKKHRACRGIFYLVKSNR